MNEENPAEKKFVSVNISLDCSAHKKLRLIASRTNLTNGEIINGILSAAEVERAEKLLAPVVARKEVEKMEKTKLKKQVESLTPERVKELLDMLKK